MHDATHLAYMGAKAEVERLLCRVESSGQELLDLIANLLDTVKLDAGKVSLKLSVVSLNEVVANVEAMLSSLAEDKEIELSSSISKSGFTIAADPVRLQQILFNLMGNALKFTSEGGAVSVTVKPRELKGVEGVEFAVRDNGIGISLEECGIIFESFRQVDGGHTREYKGSGLGLPIVRSLVELHGGVIFVESRPGLGSCFSVVLPVDGPDSVGM
jgi:signal transduction histidine kinase